MAGHSGAHGQPTHGTPPSPAPSHIPLRATTLTHIPPYHFPLLLHCCYPCVAPNIPDLRCVRTAKCATGCVSDVLQAAVLNAGIGERGNFFDPANDGWIKTLDVDLTAVLHGVRWVAGSLHITMLLRLGMGGGVSGRCRQAPSAQGSKCAVAGVRENC